MQSLLQNDTLLRTYLTSLHIAGDWDCVATVKRLPALHYSVDFIFLSFGWLVGFVALRPKSTAMVIAGRSVHLTTLFPGQA